MRLPHRAMLSSLFVLLSLSGSAQADGLSDLKAALARLHGQAPIKAVLEARTWVRHGDGKDLEEDQGQASVSIDDNARGLQIFYSKDMLARAESEERAKEKDPKSKTPTLGAMREFDSNALRPMIWAAANLSRMMEKAKLKTEKADTYNGKPARLLSFDIPIDSLSEKDKKYVKKFDGGIDVWIAADGTPLGSRSHQNVSGRAFIVISFESKNEDEQVYQLVGDRLIAVRMVSSHSGSGAGEKMEARSTKTLQLQS